MSLQSKSILFFLVILGCIACDKKEEPENLTGTRVVLIGTWEWSYSKKYIYDKQPNGSVSVHETKVQASDYPDVYKLSITSEGFLLMLKNSKTLDLYPIYFTDERILDCSMVGNENTKFEMDLGYERSKSFLICSQEGIDSIGTSDVIHLPIESFEDKNKEVSYSHIWKKVN